MVYKLFHKKSPATCTRSETLPLETLATRAGRSIKNENISNKELAEELHKPIIREFKKRKYTHLL